MRKYTHAFQNLFWHYMHTYDFTLDVLGYHLGVSRGYISKWVNGRVAFPPKYFDQTCRVFRLTGRKEEEFRTAYKDFWDQKQTEQPEGDLSETPAANRRRKLPDSNPNFVGREDEVTQVMQLIQSGCAVTLWGPGGIGKSALAAEAVLQLEADGELRKRFPDGVIFHDFYNESESKADVALDHIARWFGEEPVPTPAKAAERVLADRQILLYFDGAENADDLQRVIAARGSKCGVLITSWHESDVIKGGVGIQVKPLLPEDAEALLREVAGEYAADEKAVRRICELLGGMPLAIELAGSYLAKHKKKEELEEYITWLEDQPLEALDFGDHRMKSVPLTIQRSYAKLTPKAQQLFAVIGLLAYAPVNQEVLAAALGLPVVQIKRALWELMDYSLLVPVVEGYKVFHRLIHTYARNLQDAPENVIERLADYYTALAKEQNESGAEGQARLDPERPHILGIIKKCTESHEHQAVIKLVFVVKKHLLWKGPLAEYILALEAGLEAAEALEKPDDTGWFLTQLADSYQSSGQFEKALKLYENALHVFFKNDLALDFLTTLDKMLNLGEALYGPHDVRAVLVRGDTRNNQLSLIICFSSDEPKMPESSNQYEEDRIVLDRQSVLENLIETYHRIDATQESEDCTAEHQYILIEMADAYNRIAQPDEAIKHYQEALAISCELEDREGKVVILSGLGSTYFALGQWKRASEYYQQALSIAQQSNNQRNVVISKLLRDLGRTHYELDEMKTAISYYEQALDFSRKIGYQTLVALAVQGLGDVYRTVGRFDEALELAHEALSIYEDLGIKHGIGDCCHELGKSYEGLNQIEQAIDYYRKAYIVFNEIGDKQCASHNLGHLGKLYSNQGEHEQALMVWSQALTLRPEEDEITSNLLRRLGSTYHHLGRYNEAIEKYQTELGIDERLDHKQKEVDCLLLLAEAHRVLGQYESVIEYNKQALEILREIGIEKEEEAGGLHTIAHYYEFLHQ